MALKDILVFLDAAPASEARLRLARRIARDHRAWLSAVFIKDHDADEGQAGPDFPRRESRAPMRCHGVIDIRRRTRLGDTAEDRLRDALCSFEGDWHSLDRPDTAELIALAQGADLVVMGQSNPDRRRGSAWRPEQIVSACGRPVLMVPCFGSFDEVGRHVLVAWDGSREAARALNDALPVIGAAEAVTVMTVLKRDRDLGRGRPSMERIVDHLARHGIAARVAETLHEGSPISDVLLSRAVDFGIDMLVAGAHHHSFLRGVVGSGVTRKLFRQMTVPVLMSC